MKLPMNLPISTCQIALGIKPIMATSGNNLHQDFPFPTQTYLNLNRYLSKLSFK